MFSNRKIAVRTEKMLGFLVSSGIDEGLFHEFLSANLFGIQYIGHRLWKNYRSSVLEVSEPPKRVFFFFGQKIIEGV